MLLLIPLVGAGFYTTYFSKFGDFGEEITAFHHLHAAAASLWIICLILQPFLIKHNQYGVHKRIGKLTYVLFPLLLLSFVPMIQADLLSEHPAQAFFPLADCVFLTAYYTLAMFYRRNTPIHMRYMIGASLVFLGPTIARIGILLLGLTLRETVFIQYGILYALLIGLIALDKQHGAPYRPYLLVLAGWVLHPIILFVAIN